MSKHLQIAYQLYSVREEMAQDMEGTLARVADIGYTGVEFAGFFDKPAKEVRKMLKKFGLKAVSSHVPMQKIREDMRGVLDYHKSIDCNTIAIPYLTEEDRPGGPNFAETLKAIYAFGKLCKKYEVTLVYHNHDFEFVALSGQTGLDFLYSAVPETLLKTEIDTCWVKYAGADPVAYLQKYADRAPIVHLKDFEGSKGDNPPYALIGIESADPLESADEPFCFKPVGYGCQDIPAIVKAAKECGAKWVVVEQDESPERPALEAAQMSFDFVSTLV